MTRQNIWSTGPAPALVGVSIRTLSASIRCNVRNTRLILSWEGATLPFFHKYKLLRSIPATVATH